MEVQYRLLVCSGEQRTRHIYIRAANGRARYRRNPFCGIGKSQNRRREEERISQNKTPRKPLISQIKLC